MATALLLLLALAVAVGAGTQSFHEDTLKHARALLAKAPAGEPPILRAEDTATLPPPVRRWLDASGAVGRPRARTVRLLQRGGMRTAPDQAYMAAEARQYFIVDEPGFVWTVDVTMMRVVPVVGRDTFVDGHGRMFIKAGGLITVADGTGPKFDQSTALRYLGEIIWFPSAAVGFLHPWEPIDERRAKATLDVQRRHHIGGLRIRRAGPLRRHDGTALLQGESLKTWVIPVTEWKTIRGDRDARTRRRGLEARLRRLRLLPMGDTRRGNEPSNALGGRLVATSVAGT